MSKSDEKYLSDLGEAHPFTRAYRAWEKDKGNRALQDAMINANPGAASKAPPFTGGPGPSLTDVWPCPGPVLRGGRS